MKPIYWYKGEFEHGDAGFGLIAEAASLYVMGKRGCIAAELIKRLPGGKPSFSYSDLPEFSLSHSKDLWMCLFSKDGPVGLDVQFEKDADYLRIAERYFKADELDLIRKGGRDEFFRLWARREAFGKMTSKGFFDPDIPTLLIENGNYKELCYKFTDKEFDIGGKKAFLSALITAKTDDAVDCELSFVKLFEE